MPPQQPDPWMNRSVLRAQYRTDVNLVARQSMYAFQRPRLDLPSLALALADLTGAETIADIGCGNGGYLAELARRGHAGQTIGVDFSPGMLAVAGPRAPGAGLACGDASALPLRDGAADVSLAMHMLYHVPDQRAAARELRRVTRRGGRALVLLNGEDHLRELRDLVAASKAADLTAFGGRLRLDRGAELLSGVFSSVTRYDYVSELVLPGPEPVEAYLRSIIAGLGSDPDAVIGDALAAIPFGPDGAFRVRTHCGCLVCR